MEYSKYSRRKRHWNNKRGSEEVSKNIETKSVNKNNHGKQETTLPMEVQLMMQKNQEAIKELKHRQTLCALCGEPIVELSAALADKKTDAPVHFDCVMAEIKKTESLKENEKISYIGQGRFAVVHFPNPHDTKNFTIVRVIEWEQRDKVYDWRQELAGLYSQVH